MNSRDALEPYAVYSIDDYCLGSYCYGTLEAWFYMSSKKAAAIYGWLSYGELDYGAKKTAAVYFSVACMTGSAAPPSPNIDDALGIDSVAFCCEKMSTIGA